MSPAPSASRAAVEPGRITLVLGLEGITWKFVLVPEPIQNLTFVVASDRFEGYARERAQILDFIQSFCIENVVFTYGIDPVLPNGGDVPVVNRLRVDAATRKANGQVCGNDTACASCRCSAGFCAAGLDNGSVCLTDAQCNSDRCALQGLLLRCQPKLGNGAKCVNDNDCLAGDCALSVDPPGRRCWPVPD